MTSERDQAPQTAESQSVAPDLAGASVLRSRRDAPWAVLADAALVVFAVEVAWRFRLSWGLGVLAAVVLLVGMQFARYRWRVVATAAQVKLAAGMLVMAASVAAFVSPRPGASISVLGAVGLAKLVRELALYLSLKRRMLDLGKRRRRNPRHMMVPAAVFLVTAALAFSGLRIGAGGVRVAFVVWLCAYSLVTMVMELWA